MVIFKVSENLSGMGHCLKKGQRAKGNSDNDNEYDVFFGRRP